MAYDSEPHDNQWKNPGETGWEALGNFLLWLGKGLVLCAIVYGILMVAFK